jgi:hypothetical protein
VDEDAGFAPPVEDATGGTVAVEEDFEGVGAAEDDAGLAPPVEDATGGTVPGAVEDDTGLTTGGAVDEDTTGLTVAVDDDLTVGGGVGGFGGGPFGFLSCAAKLVASCSDDCWASASAKSSTGDTSRSVTASRRSSERGRCRREVTMVDVEGMGMVLVFLDRSVGLHSSSLGERAVNTRG